MNKNWDIFCRIVDNFGDIGVCWRLAKQLQAEHGLTITIWVDDLNAAQKIIPELSTDLSQQDVHQIQIAKWHENTDFTSAADVVIEAFACELPTAYVNAMAQKKSKWINLEYLSAEAWVADFHAKPSPQANGLIRYFYFPGFTDNTGGLIRESFDYAQDERSISEKPQLYNVRPKLGEGYDTLKLSLFCYPNAPIYDLFTALQANKTSVVVYVPATGILPTVANFFGKNSMQIGEQVTQGNLTVQVLPFLSQADYDQLLSECDINFVRGEDSWVRAIWAAKPFIWQPYYQEENTHIKKLEAFLTFFYMGLDTKSAVFKMHADWASAQLTTAVWQDYLRHLSHINRFTLQQSKQLTKQADLASQLVNFCNKVE